VDARRFSSASVLVYRLLHNANDRDVKRILGTALLMLAACGHPFEVVIDTDEGGALAP
jgi:hypothetical protein